MIKLRRRKVCECGCGEYAKHGNKFIQYHQHRGKKQSYETIVKKVFAYTGKWPMMELKLCECGKCDEYIKSDYHRFVSGHQRRNKKSPEGSRKLKEKWQDPIWRQKVVAAQNEGKSRPEVKKRRIEIARKQFSTLEARERNSEARKKEWQDPVLREKFCLARRNGWPEESRKRKSQQVKEYAADPLVRERLSKQAKEWMEVPENRERISESVRQAWANNPELRQWRAEKSYEQMKRQWQDPDYIFKMMGPNAPGWKGGIQAEPYCEVWSDKDFKDFIKERDDYQCQNPDCPKTSERPCIHHIDYDKQNCRFWNLITLCIGCNSKANGNRDYWEYFYTEIMKEKGYIKIGDDKGEGRLEHFSPPLSASNN